MSSFDTSETPHLTIIRCEGDLAITGADRRTITVFGDDQEPTVERQGESFTITVQDDCGIHCPPGASVTIKSVDGDLTVQGLEGPLAVESADGDVALRSVGPATLRQVRGDLEVRSVQGELNVESADGDVKVRQAAKMIKLQLVRGDLAARDLEGGVAVERVVGDISLSTALSPGTSFHLTADGDIAAKVDVGSGARLTLVGDELHCRLPLQTTERSSGRMVGTLGDGSAELVLQAGGDLSVAERGESWGWTGEGHWESAMESWAQQFETHMAEMQRKLEERLANIPFVDSESIAHRARQAAERAKRQAERSAERAQARAERTHRRHEHGAGVRWSWSPPQPARPPAEPVSDAERMAILKMVSDKKITADEASQLLAALEGEA